MSTDTSGAKVLGTDWALMQLAGVQVRLGGSHLDCFIQMTSFFGSIKWQYF
jgi:hypothetical protein